MALSWSIPSIRPGAGAFCCSNVWMWPKVDPSRPARNESAYRGTPGAGEAAVDVVGIPAYDPERPFAFTARVHQSQTFPCGDRQTVSLDWSAMCCGAPTASNIEGATNRDRVGL